MFEALAGGNPRLIAAIRSINDPSTEALIQAAEAGSPGWCLALIMAALAEQNQRVHELEVLAGVARNGAGVDVC
jgi:hypothetical protein